MADSTKSPVIAAPTLPFTYGLPPESASLPPASIARAVSTSHGRTLTFEWGPESGRKILFLCGGGTPVPMLYPLADRLSKHGNRVLLFDYYGRGYSDCPTKLHHDKALHISQSIEVLKSSPIEWTGPESTGFSIIGYSIGGAIAMAFAAASHALQVTINDMVLLAPAGLLKDCLPFIKGVGEPETYSEQHLKEIIKPVVGAEVETEDTASIDNGQKTNEPDSEKAELSQIMQWQFEYHQGYPFGQLSMLLHGPIEAQHEDWRTVVGMYGQKTKILAIFATDDPVVKQTEVRPEIEKIVADAGSETTHKESTHQTDAQFTFSTIIGDHEFPFTKVDQVAATITQWFDTSRTG